MALPVPEAHFVHLHVHSEYSILDGACRIPALAERAASSEMPAVTLTDHGSIAGAVELHREARKQGIKPIVGCEVYVADDRRRQEKGYAHLTVLAESNEGYANLIKLSSLGYLEGYYYKPRVDWELLERHAKGLVVLSGCLSGPRLEGARGDRPQDAAADLDRLVQIFGRDSTYVEIQNAGLEPQQRINPQLAKLAETTGLPLVATGDVHYLLHEDARAHEALLCIQSGDSLKNPNHWRFDTDQFYFKTPEEMARRLRRLPGCAARGRSRWPSAATSRSRPTGCCSRRFPTPDGRDAFEYLAELCEAGLARRYETVTPELRDRLQFELKTIREMGFADYFLIVWDFIHFAKTNGVQVGPGPRLGGGLARRLLPARSPTSTRCGTGSCSSASSTRAASRCRTWTSTSPSAGRERVINYVAEKYGRDRVAQIITFSTMMARAAVRDAGRVLEVPYGTVDKVAKMIPEGPKVYLEDNLKPGQELRHGLRRRPAGARRSSTSPSRSRGSSAPTRSTPPASSSPTGR